MKINYYLKMKEEVASLTGAKKKLLVHSCCGVCSTSVLQQLSQHFDITLYYFNNNIYPESEYFKRLATIQQLIDCFNKDHQQNIKVIAAEYNYNEYLNECVVANENRCQNCFKYRIKKAIDFANQRGFDYVTSSLTTGRFKNAMVINKIASELMETSPLTVKYLYSDFKKNNGQGMSVEISHKYNLYRQNYCGCEFSLPERSGGISEDD